MKRTIKKLPKIELHLHLDGSVRVETMYEILRENNEIDEMEIEKFRELVSITGDCKSLVEYLEKFELPGKVMQNEKNLERITYELLEDLSRDNVKYVEIRFAPYLHMNEGLSFDQVMESVILGMNKGMEDFNIKANLILIAMRHDSLDKTIELVKNGEKYINKGVVAVDLAGNEHDFPPEIHKKAFKLAKELGYKITIHAGETGIEKNIITSIDELYASRIGHGVAAIKDIGIMNKLRDENIYLEMCPVSNIQTKAIDSIENYPMEKFIEYGIKATVNTDNMTVSNTDLNREYSLLIDRLKFTIEDIKKLILNSVEASFLSTSEKLELKSIVEAELAQL